MSVTYEYFSILGIPFSIASTRHKDGFMALFCKNSKVARSSFSPAWFRWAVALTLCGFMLGCGKKDKDEEARTPYVPPTEPKSEPVSVELTGQEKTWWISKANQTLRLGQPLRELKSVSPDTLSGLKMRDAAAAIMDDVAFYDMLTDFSMYWLGVKQNDLYQSESVYVPDPSGGVGTTKTVHFISGTAKRSLPALHAARAVASGKDYFESFFSEKGVPPAFEYTTGYFQEEGSLNLPAAERRGKIVKHLVEVVEKVSSDSTIITKEQLCAKYDTEVKFYDIGTYGPLGFRVFASKNSDKFDNNFSTWCFLDADGDVRVGIETLKSVVDSIEKTVKFYAVLDERLKGKNLNEGHVVELPALDYSGADHVMDSNVELWPNLLSSIENSSTNRNRKRASWVLKRFLCDDLTPINVDAGSSSHADGQHGSDAACYSCHYKLDPMAGYFRELGLVSSSFSAKNFIIFDDLAKAERIEYERPWKAAPESGREWNIGYIRSTTKTNQNIYGSNFSDLLVALKTLPEVKECFVRRVFEYTVGSEQAYDRAWGKQVLDRMTETAKKDPKAALKGVFTDMVTSNAFIARERNNNVCYDFASGTVPSNRAPCRIATIVERNCTSCHNKAGAQGGLDLSSWEKQSDGVFGFNLVDGNVKVPAKETFQRIMERLNTSDADLRMPLMKSMPDSERQEMFLWLEKNSH